jgi:hypothetical protein
MLSAWHLAAEQVPFTDVALCARLVFVKDALRP